MNSLPRLAVIGAGYFGRFHAEKLARLPTCRLLAVVDISQERAAAAAPPGVEPLTDFRALAGKVDAVSIAAPTSLHFELAHWFLERGIHTFIEKPITETTAQAQLLIEQAARRKLVLQIGHIQRVLLRRLNLTALGVSPRLIQATRVHPYRPRAIDVGVVLDLMIHDIDLVLALNSQKLAAVSAVGERVVSSTEDYASARLEFADGSEAHLTAARISPAVERIMRIFGPEGSIQVDLQARRATVIRADRSGAVREETLTAPAGDDLASELSEFVDCVVNASRPTVDGEAGLRALSIAIEVLRQINPLRQSGDA
jgi:predicted dehydrogenase